MSTRLERLTTTVATVGMVIVTGVVVYIGATDDGARLRPSDLPTVTVTVPTPSPTGETYTIHDGDPEWNCLTMGDLHCDGGWVGIPEDLYDGLGVSDDEQCEWLVGDTTVIVCSDGQVIVS